MTTTKRGVKTSCGEQRIQGFAMYMYKDNNKLATSNLPELFSFKNPEYS